MSTQTTWPFKFDTHARMVAFHPLNKDDPVAAVHKMGRKVRKIYTTACGTDRLIKILEKIDRWRTKLLDLKDKIIDERSSGKAVINRVSLTAATKVSEDIDALEVLVKRLLHPKDKGQVIPYNVSRYEEAQRRRTAGRSLENLWYRSCKVMIKAERPHPAEYGKTFSRFLVRRDVFQAKYAGRVEEPRPGVALATAAGFKYENNEDDFAYQKDQVKGQDFEFFSVMDGCGFSKELAKREDENAVVKKLKEDFSKTLMAKMEELITNPKDPEIFIPQVEQAIQITCLEFERLFAENKEQYTKRFVLREQQFGADFSATRDTIYDALVKSTLSAAFIFSDYVFVVQLADGKIFSVNTENGSVTKFTSDHEAKFEERRVIKRHAAVVTTELDSRVNGVIPWTRGFGADEYLSPDIRDEDEKAKGGEEYQIPIYHAQADVLVRPVSSFGPNDILVLATDGHFGGDANPEIIGEALANYHAQRKGLTLADAAKSLIMAAYEKDKEGGSHDNCTVALIRINQDSEKIEPSN